MTKANFLTLLKLYGLIMLWNTKIPLFCNFFIIRAFLFNDHVHTQPNRSAECKNPQILDSVHAFYYWPLILRIFGVKQQSQLHMW